MDERFYATQSLYEGAYLLTRNCRLKGKDTSGKKTTLLFEKSSGIEKKAAEFYNRAKVEAKAYSDCYRSLKDFIFTK